MNNLILRLNNMARGKETCRILKEIRKQIAEANDIKYVTEECKHKGDCLGTCPKCEAELQYLEDQLNQRRLLGKAVVVAGVSLSLSLGAAASTPQEFAQTFPDVQQAKECNDSYKTYKKAKKGKYCIKGIVVDNQKEPVIGADVLDKDSKFATCSNIDGTFEFYTDKEEITLTFAFIGYISKTITLKKENYDQKLTITLEEDLENLSDAIIFAGAIALKKKSVFNVFKKKKKNKK